MVVELCQSMGPVSSRKMFGGYGLFLNGLMFGLIADSCLYFKVDEQSKPEFVSRDLEPFYYSKNGKDYAMSYFQAPEEALEDPEEMNTWGNIGYGAALRAAAGKKARPSRKTKASS